MPRLPTIRAIGSQAISTRLVVDRVPAGRGLVAVMAGSPGPLRAGHELAGGPAPLRLLVDGPGGDRAEPAHRRAVHARRCGGGPAAGGFVHEGHELVREAGHRAADADAAHVGAAAHPVDPAAL